MSVISSCSFTSEWFSTTSVTVSSFTSRSTLTLFMIRASASMSGRGRPVTSETLSAISGRIRPSTSCFSRRCCIERRLLRYDFSSRAASRTASSIRLRSPASPARSRASFDSLVKGTFVDAMWMLMTAGPLGPPDPPG